MLLLLAYSPTAQISLVEITVNPCRMLFPRSTFGLGTMLHFDPSQCWMSVCDTLLLLMYRPTVQMSLAEAVPTSNRSLVCEPTFGLETTLHCVPSQCMVSVRSFLLLLVEVPTAHTSFAETVVTLLRKLLFDPTFGLGTILHFVPFQCWISV